MSHRAKESYTEGLNKHAAALASSGFVRATLVALPPEVLAQVVTHIETVKPLFYLSQTCKRLSFFVKQHGLQVFVKTRFPYVQPPALHSQSFWRDAALGLTTLDRNLDRKAFIAWSINLRVDQSRDSRRHRAYFRAGQTMGFIPVLDSYETWYGGDWSSRKEVVVWGAGAHLEMRIKTMGSKAKDLFEATTDRRGFNIHQQRIKMAEYREEAAVEGKDDITSVIVVPQQSLEDPEQLVIGRASGGLSRISLSADSLHGQARSLASYETAGRLVRSTTRNESRKHFFAACFSDSSIALYPLDTPSTRVTPLGEVSVAKAAISDKIWSSRFLGCDRLAVGCGFSREPIQVYDIGCGQFTEKGARSLAIINTDAETQLDLPDIVTSGPTSIYSLARIPSSSSAGGFNGEVFLSGAYDGMTRLHDLRAPNPTTAVFRDPVDTFSPIYSLLTIGTERFIAGGARHSIIKVFDIRNPGVKMYHAAAVDPCSSQKRDFPKRPKQKKMVGCSNYHDEAKYNRRGWNVFLNVQVDGRRRESPVYSLSRPSQCSPSLFAGIENSIVQLDMVSIMDQYSDPLFKDGPSKSNGHWDVRRNWDPHEEAIPMSMYEHDTGSVKLLKQQPQIGYSRQSIRPGLDERWTNGSLG